MIWEAKECKIYIRTKSVGAALAKPFRLIVARNVLSEKEEEIKYFVSNAPLDAEE